MGKLTENETLFLDLLYDFILDPSITERERKIGISAKKDIEAGRYPVGVINQVMATFQQEALKVRLTSDASKFYDKLGPILNKIAPLGTNRGSMLVNRSYLD